jgi:hypothetical protein
MKINQIMSVRIGENHSIAIGHLNKMGNLNDVLAIGNSYRRNKGLKDIGLDEYLRRNETWEFIQEVELKYSKNPKREIPVLEKDSKNRVLYSKYIKKFSVIKSQRGGKVENRGIWANLQIMLDLAIYLSPTLRLEMIDTLPDRKDKSNQGIYIQIAKQFREKLEILDTKGYNEKEHNSFIQETRAKWLDRLISMIDTELITSYKQLVEILDKLK